MGSLALLLGSAALMGSVVPASAATLTLSTRGGATLAGTTFRDGDLVQYDDVAASTTLFFDEDLFSDNVDIDAVHVLPNGHIVLSTETATTLGGLAFSTGDLVEYDPIAGTASLYFSEALFSDAANIDAVSILANGNIVLSTSDPETLGGLSFRDADLALYDPIADTATLLFSEDLFADGAEIDAVHVLPDGRIILSTGADEILGGLSFRDGDLALYNPVNGLASLFFDEDLFVDNENLGAVFVPEPGTGLLLALGLLALAVRGGGPRAASLRSR